MRNNCRVILTDRCNLDCGFCCMKDKDTSDSFIVDSALHIAYGGKSYDKYDEYAITGGEPMLEFEKLVQFICLIKYFNSNAKVYLYTNGYLLSIEAASTLKVAGLTGINWSPHKKPGMGRQNRMQFIHACLIPVRILIQDTLLDDDILKYALDNSMQIKQWTIGDCDEMGPEDRYRIDWNII